MPRGAAERRRRTADSACSQGPPPAPAGAVPPRAADQHRPTGRPRTLAAAPTAPDPATHGPRSPSVASGRVDDLAPTRRAPGATDDADGAAHPSERAPRRPLRGPGPLPRRLGLRRSAPPHRTAPCTSGAGPPRVPATGAVRRHASRPSAEPDASNISATGGGRSARPSPSTATENAHDRRVDPLEQRVADDESRPQAHPHGPVAATPGPPDGGCRARRVSQPTVSKLGASGSSPARSTAPWVVRDAPESLVGRGHAKRSAGVRAQGDAHLPERTRRGGPLASRRGSHPARPGWRACRSRVAPGDAVRELVGLRDAAQRRLPASSRCCTAAACRDSGAASASRAGTPAPIAWPATANKSFTATVSPERAGGAVPVGRLPRRAARPRPARPGGRSPAATPAPGPRRSARSGHPPDPHPDRGARAA